MNDMDLCFDLHITGLIFLLMEICDNDFSDVQTVMRLS